MAHWLIDTGNTKRGLFFTKHQDISSNGKLLDDGNGNLVPVLGEEKMFKAHSAVDPRNLRITSEQDGSDVKVYMGLTRSENIGFKVPLDLDAIKTFLDSDEGRTSPTVFVSYVFANKDEDISTRTAVENHKYISKLSKNQPDMIDIKTGEVLWTAPDSKHVINYMFAGKVSGIPNTYYLCLNSFRTELYEDIPSGDNHSFEFLDAGFGTLKNVLLRPIINNGSLLDNDIIIAPKAEFSINLYSNKGYIGQRSLTASDVTVNVKTNLTYTKSEDGLLTFNFGDKTTGYVSLHIASNSLLDQDPDLSIRRTFTVHRG